MTLPSGTQLGPYRIVELIGSGGMGVVYRAHDARLGRDVALKVISDALDAQPEAAARFEHEARAAAALSHPNIVAIHDLGHVDGRPYAVTELLEGESLRARLDRGPLTWREAVEIALAVADGLAAAHARGIVHRDIKPENLFVTRDRLVKILDFGLARAHLQRPLEGEAPTRAVTEAGLIVGTVGYLSPEQVRGEAAGPASDVFALGCVIYEMIAGRRAFEGHTTIDRLAAVLQASPTPLTSERAPADVARIVERCLEKAPERRFAQGRELADALQALLSESGARHALDRPKAARTRTMRSLAVLPFDLTPENPDAEFLGEGLAESIINNLSALPRLRVVPRSTVFRYKGRGLDVGAIGRELGVTNVLAGHLTWRGEQLKLQVELVSPADEAQVWGQSYTRRVDDIFVLQEALARDISEALQVRLTPPTKRKIARRATVDPDAYQDYLRGRFLAAKYSPEGFAHAIACFEAAVAKDPAYAQAHAELGDAVGTSRFFGYVLPEEGLARARTSVARALALDKDLPEAHAASGKIAFFFDRHFDEAERAFGRALELAPSYAECRIFSALLDVCLGRRERGLAAAQRAVDDAPLSPLVNAGLSFVRMFAGDVEGAIAQAKHTLTIDPHFFLAMQELWFGCEQLGRFDEALTYLEPCLAALGFPSAASDRVRRGWKEGGVGGYWEARLAILQEEAARRYVPPQMFMYVYARLGDTERALVWAERLYQIDSGILVFLGVDPCVSELRRDARFRELIARSGLPFQMPDPVLGAHA